jgi:hypothetical protein
MKEETIDTNNDIAVSNIETKTIAPNNGIAATPNVFNRKAGAPNPALGPLQALVNGNQWVGNTGFNLMVVPHPTQQFLVMVSPIFETHIFEEVPAPVPNRTMLNGTEQVGAVKYSQIVAENVTKNILHEETGMWLNQTTGDFPNRTPPPPGFGLEAVHGEPAVSLATTNTILRSGTIPHGNTVHATGPWNDTSFTAPTSGDVLPYIALSNFPNDGANLKFLPVFVDGSDATELQQDYIAQIAQSLALIGSSDMNPMDFVNPIGFLNSQANNLTDVVSMAVTTVNKDGGGVFNIPFETQFVAPQGFICTFLIETVANLGTSGATTGAQDENPSYLQLQYLQSIPLLFPKGYNGKDVLFPHWNLNTLIAI